MEVKSALLTGSKALRAGQYNIRGKAIVLRMAHNFPFNFHFNFPFNFRIIFRFNFRINFRINFHALS